MSTNKTDDYWNRSLSTGFSFDDEDDTSKGLFTNSTLTFEANSIESAFSSSPLDTDLYVLPIQTVISKKNLDAVLDDVLQSKPAYREVKETIKRMVLNQPYNLICYHSLMEKEELLDEATTTMDGDVILNVVLFLLNTLNSSNFHRIISKRKEAWHQYLSYLGSRLQTQQLSNTLLSVGSSSEIIEIFYMASVDIPSVEGVLSKLGHFIVEHFGEIVSEREKSVLLDYQNFLKWQKTENSKSQSVTEELTNLCNSTWKSKGADENKIIEFKKLMKISDLQYEWVLLNTLAAAEQWDKILSMFIKSNWLTKKNVIKSVIDVQILLLGLFRHNPPKNVIIELLNCIPDSDISFHLAKQMKCYRFAVDSYINQRDRLGLILYKNQLPAQSEEFFYAESALHSLNVKWKN
ncbi:vacuolar protein sorting-associated protein 16B isoform X1 [Agrilus planipennis]|uniref:Vacuolar protein sorting-associated protein 16B isoform X1 n=1 Tax=Agrilus planipennis TaxID=224129 RepID=A0A1W4WKJ1_AGRPL|nr:vacuolar protein sorting-associated protein 16B isoform X1 [Agrilus planipennis]